jgi:FixJ family two-component response regulator
MTHLSLPIHLVDDDPAILKAVSRLLRVAGYEVFAYSSAEEFLNNHATAAPGCAVLDVSMPGFSGLELQEWLARSGASWPVIFVSGHSNIPISVRAMKAGAVDFLTKPVDEDDLLRAVEVAIVRGVEQQTRDRETDEIRTRLAKLTAREREVLEHVVSGQLNKEVASDLGTVEKTIKVHRARIMRKMGASSLAALVRMAERVGIGGGETVRASEPDAIGPRANSR